MGSTSTLAAVVRVLIFSPCEATSVSSELPTFPSHRKPIPGRSELGIQTHGNLNAFVGEDQSGISGSKFVGLGRSSAPATAYHDPRGSVNGDSPSFSATNLSPRQETLWRCSEVDDEGRAGGTGCNFV